MGDGICPKHTPNLYFQLRDLQLKCGGSEMQFWRIDLFCLFNVPCSRLEIKQIMLEPTTLDSWCLIQLSSR